MSRIDRIKNILGRTKEGFTKAFGEGREDHRQALKRGYEVQDMETDATMWNQMMGSNRTVTMARELLGQADPEMVLQREAMGLGLDKDKATKIGQILGTLAGDIVQDRGRSIYWLLNAPQATGNVIQELALRKHAPDLYKTKRVEDSKGRPVTRPQRELAEKMGLVDSENRPKAGITIKKEMVDDGQGNLRPSYQYRERGYQPGFVDALSIPTGLAINSSIGLMNPFGGQEGYKAVIESEEDPSKTANVLGEIASKYILGRTGNLLPWDEFKQVRPDVSKDEYMRYKAFKFDNDMDVNPMDGDVVLPGGIIKYTDEGIHGPEVQFLGRSLPLATGILPTAAAIAGTTIGARMGGRNRGVRGGFIGGMGAYGASALLGNVIEGERRRRNADENSIGLN